MTIFAASATASINHVIDSEMKADYIVNTSGPGSTLPPSAAAQIGQVPGVAVSSGLRIGSMKFAGTVEQVEAVDPAVVDGLFDVGRDQGEHGRPRDRRPGRLQAGGQGQGLDDRVEGAGAVRQDRVRRR